MKPPLGNAIVQIGKARHLVGTDQNDNTDYGGKYPGIQVENTGHNQRYQHQRCDQALPEHQSAPFSCAPVWPNRRCLVANSATASRNASTPKSGHNTGVK